MTDSADSSTVSAARWSIIQGVVGTVLQFATLAALARMLAPSVFGAMAILMVVQGIATLFAQSGLSSALIQKKELTRDALHSIYWLNVILGGGVTVALLLGAPLISAAFDLPQLTATTRAIGLTFFVTGWAVQYQALAQRQMRLRRIALIQLAGLLVTAVVSVALALKGLELWALVAGLIAATLVRTVAFLVLGVRDNGPPDWVFDWTQAREMVIFGTHRFGAMLANSVNSQIDQLLVGMLLGAQALGFYSIGTRVVRQPVDLINAVVTRVAFPVLSRAQDDDTRLRDTYLRLLGLVTAVNAPLLAGAAVLAPWYVPLLLGEGWEPAIVLIQILSAYALLRSIVNAGGSLILAKGRADWTLYWNLLLLVLFPITLYLASRANSLTVLAASLVALQLLVVILYHRLLVQPLTSIRFGRFANVIVPPVFAAIVAGAATHTALHFLDQPSPWLNLALGTLIGTTVYALLARVLLPQQVAALIAIASRAKDKSSTQ